MAVYSLCLAYPVLESDVPLRTPWDIGIARRSGCVVSTGVRNATSGALLKFDINIKAEIAIPNNNPKTNHAAWHKLPRTAAWPPIASAAPPVRWPCVAAPFGARRVRGRGTGGVGLDAGGFCIAIREEVPIGKPTSARIWLYVLPCAPTGVQLVARPLSLAELSR